MSGPYGILDCLDLCRDCWELAEEMVPGEVSDPDGGWVCRECAKEWEKNRAAEAASPAPEEGGGDGA